jgi:hypothetical protein
MPSRSFATDAYCAAGTMQVLLGPRDNLRILRSDSSIEAVWFPSSMGFGGTVICDINTVDEVSIIDESCELDLLNCLETKGRSEIEIAVSLGSDSSTHDDLIVAGSAGADDIVIGSGGANLNGDDDVDLTFSGVETVAVLGAGGNDRLQAAGGRGTGKSCTRSVRLEGGSGSDVLVGGAGVDALVGGDGADVMYARDGRADTVAGGRGTDRARVDRGRDKVSLVERFI